MKHDFFKAMDRQRDMQEIDISARHPDEPMTIRLIPTVKGGHPGKILMLISLSMIALAVLLSLGWRLAELVMLISRAGGR